MVFVVHTCDRHARYRLQLRRERSCESSVLLTAGREKARRRPWKLQASTMAPLFFSRDNMIKLGLDTRASVTMNVERRTTREGVTPLAGSSQFQTHPEGDGNEPTGCSDFTGSGVRCKGMIPNAASTAGGARGVCGRYGCCRCCCSCPSALNDDDNEHWSSGWVSAHTALTCPEGQSAWAWAHSLSGERVRIMQETIVQVFPCTPRALRMKWDCICTGKKNVLGVVWCDVPVLCVCVFVRVAM